MSKQGKDNSKLEEMLRRWGAQEAASKVKLPSGAARGGGGGEQVRVVIRWAMYSAAAAAVIAVAVWVGSLLSRPIGSEDTDLQDRLARVQDESKTYYVKWMESDKQLREQTSRTQTALNELQAIKAQRVSPDARVSDLEVRLQELQKDLAQEKEQQRVTLAALEVARKSAGREATTHPQAAPAPVPPSRDVAALQDQVIRLEAKVGNYEDRFAAAADELARLKRGNDDWAKKIQAAQDELAGAKAVAARDFEQAQAAYLAAAAPTDRGLKARQSASKRARLVQRVTALRRGDPPQAAVAVLDRLEVVLTRLDLIDPNESRATRSFVKLLDNGGLVQKIDAATTIPNATPELLSVLAEAKLVLAGAENVI
jgi:hypothetical protein